MSKARRAGDAISGDCEPGRDGLLVGLSRGAGKRRPSGVGPRAADERPSRSLETVRRPETLARPD